MVTYHKTTQCLNPEDIDFKQFLVRFMPTTVTYVISETGRICLHMKLFHVNCNGVHAHICQVYKLHDSNT